MIVDQWQRGCALIQTQKNRDPQAMAMIFLRVFYTLAVKNRSKLGNAWWKILQEAESRKREKQNVSQATRDFISLFTSTIDRHQLTHGFSGLMNWGRWAVKTELIVGTISLIVHPVMRSVYTILVRANKKREKEKRAIEKASQQETVNRQITAAAADELPEKSAIKAAQLQDPADAPLLELQSKLSPQPSQVRNLFTFNQQIKRKQSLKQKMSQLQRDQSNRKRYPSLTLQPVSSMLQLTKSLEMFPRITQLEVAEIENSSSNPNIAPGTVERVTGTSLQSLKKIVDLLSKISAPLELPNVDSLSKPNFQQPMRNLKQQKSTVKGRPGATKQIRLKNDRPSRKLNPIKGYEDNKLEQPDINNAFPSFDQAFLELLMKGESEKGIKTRQKGSLKEIQEDPVTLRYAINDKKGEEKMPDKRTTRIEAAKIIEEKAPRLVKKMLEGKVKTHNNQGIKQPKEKQETKGKEIADFKSPKNPSSNYFPANKPIGSQKVLREAKMTEEKETAKKRVHFDKQSLNPGKIVADKLTGNKPMKSGSMKEIPLAGMTPIRARELYGSPHPLPNSTKVIPSGKQPSKASQAPYSPRNYTRGNMEKKEKQALENCPVKVASLFLTKG